MQIPTIEDFQRMLDKLDRLEKMIASLQPPVQEEWVETKEAMQMLKVSEKTLYNWRKDNELPYYQHGKIIRYRRQDILDRMKAMHIMAAA